MSIQVIPEPLFLCCRKQHDHFCIAVHDWSSRNSATTLPPLNPCSPLRSEAQPKDIRMEVGFTLSPPRSCSRNTHLHCIWVYLMNTYHSLKAIAHRACSRAPIQQPHTISYLSPACRYRQIWPGPFIDPRFLDTRSSWAWFVFDGHHLSTCTRLSQTLTRYCHPRCAIMGPEVLCLVVAAS